jgi:hypothetical protein
MAETVTEPPAETPPPEVAPPEPEAAPEPEPEAAPEELVVALPRKVERSYRKRFRIVYFVLGLVVVGAVAGFVAVALQPGKEPAAAWAGWEPSGGEEGWPQQIADHIAGGYRLPSGNQLVTVQAAPARVQDVPLGAIAVRKPPPEGTGDVSVDIFPVEGVQVYILCGLGQDCAIAEGEPSAERLRLLRREALELSLYTFRHVEGTNSIVVFLPPRLGETPTYALFFQRGALSSELDRPLRATLPDETPPLPEQIRPIEVATIDRLTDPTLFRFSFQQLQDGTAVLVLDDLRLPAPEPEEPPQDGEQAPEETVEPPAAQ